LWCTNNPEERKEHKHRSNSKRRAVLNNCYAEHITQEEMSLILDQYQTCPYCNISLHKKNTQLDHVYPLSKGGQHTIFNLMPCCADCNNIKQNKLPINWFLK
jgi:5-methylcytosine-specific restriction endonuclease McrA